MKNIFFGIGFSVMMCFCVLFAADVKLQVNTAIQNCLTIIIPSLYGFMILSDLAVRTNFYKILSKPFGFLGRIFNIPSELVSVFIISHLGGYPIGIKLLCDLREKNKIDSKIAERMSLYCFASGPAFTFGIFAGNGNLALVLFLSICISDFIIAIITGFLEPSCKKNNKNTLEKTQFNYEIINNSVMSTAKTCFVICAVILMFAVILGVVKHFFINNIFSAITDVTNIVFLKTGNVPLLAAILSFGGICVFFQIITIAKGKIHFGKFLISRIYNTALTYVVSSVLTEIMLKNQNFSFALKEINIVPVLILIGMSFFIFVKYSPRSS